MAASKTRLKFRVSAHDGVSSGGLPEPRWSEKWGVGLFDYEEFHVTDQLLKLPFQESTPKTVCVFAISDGALVFRMVDEDRAAKVNGALTRETIVSIGDRIQIGETVTIEIVLAPPRDSARSRPPPEPSLSKSIPEIPALDPEEGPTLTLVPTGSHELDRRKPPAPKPVFQEASRSVVIDEPSLNGRLRTKKPTTFGSGSSPSPAPKPSGPHPAFAVSEKVELAGKETPKPIPPRPAGLASASAGPLPGFVPEEKVELSEAQTRIVNKVPSRPPSLSPGAVPGFVPDEKVELAEVPDALSDLTEENIRPLFPEEANLVPRPSLAERILSALSRILRRDDLDPPEEPFPAEEEEGSLFRPSVVDPGIRKAIDPGKTPTTDGGSAESKAESNPKAWIPEFVSASARLRGRVLVFLVAAVGALLIAVGVLRIQYRIATMKSPKPEEVPKVRPDFERGIPISIIEEKVRRMRSNRR